MDLSFAGAGFMGYYYCGAMDFWRRFVPLERVNRIAGTSAGAIVGSIYLLEVSIADFLKASMEVMKIIKSNKWGPFDRSFLIGEALIKTLDDLYPKDAHLRASNRLFVCMTRLKGLDKQVVSQYESRQDLINAVSASGYVPIWSGKTIPYFRGEQCFDGGIADNFPVFNENTIKISAYSGDADLNPNDRFRAKPPISITALNTPLYLTLTNCKRIARAMWPLPPRVTGDLVRRGFNDARRFLLDNDMIQCEPCYRKSLASGAGPLCGLRNPSISQEPQKQQKTAAKVWRQVPEIVISGNHRQSSLAEEEEQLGGANFTPYEEDRYTLARGDLPSCPPSPTLRRHCRECAELREQARNAQLDEEITKVVDSFLAEEAANKSGGSRSSKSKLLFPFRWFGKIGTKRSYDFEHKN